jgi:hypothetical protein
MGPFGLFNKGQVLSPAGLAVMHLDLVWSHVIHQRLALCWQGGSASLSTC